jgi:transcriptional regulator with XRE-family HTH domain
MTRSQLAGPDLSESYISLIESGQCKPTPLVVGLLAERLDCSVSYLEWGEDVPDEERLD